MNSQKNTQNHLLEIINNALVANGLKDIEYTVSKSSTGILIETKDKLKTKKQDEQGK